MTKLSANDVAELILRNHGKQTRNEGGRLEAYDVVYGPNGEDRSAWVDVTGWTAQQLMKWLGY